MQATIISMIISSKSSVKEKERARMEVFLAEDPKDALMRAPKINGRFFASLCRCVCIKLLFILQFVMNMVLFDKFEHGIDRNKILKHICD